MNLARFTPIGLAAAAGLSFAAALACVTSQGDRDIPPAEIADCIGECGPLPVPQQGGGGSRLDVNQIDVAANNDALGPQGPPDGLSTGVPNLPQPGTNPGPGIDLDAQFNPIFPF